MPVPITYPSMSKGNFVDARSPPLLPQYGPLAFEKYKSGSHRRGDSVSWLNDKVRNHGVTIIGEFFGTFLFLFFGLTSVQVVNGKPDRLAQVESESGLSLLQLLYISVGFGTSLAVNVWLFFRISGGMFNPAVTLGLCLAGGIPWIKAFLLIPVQLIAGIVASILVSGLFPGVLNVQTNLGSGTSVVQGLFIEMMLTAELIFAILMLAVEKHRATFMAPLGIGMALFLAHIIGVNFTGASLNPTRTLGPAVVLGEFTTYHWIYWAGPVMGAFIAVGLYKLLKFLEYETANSSQDSDGLDIYRVISKRRVSNDSFTSLSPLTGVE